MRWAQPMVFASSDRWWVRWRQRSAPFTERIPPSPLAASSPMKIAIDAHSIGSKAGGNETFYRQLVRGLAAESGDHQYHIFFTHAAALEAIPRDSRFSVTRIPQNPIVRNGVTLP